jgi:hypothetical protein
MDIQRVGNDFTTSIKLDLVPHIKLPRGWIVLEYECTTDTIGYMHTTINGISSSIMEFGRDVYSIKWRLYCHNSFPTNPLLNIRSPEITIGELILLNLACKLLKTL